MSLYLFLDSKKPMSSQVIFFLYYLNKVLLHFVQRRSHLHCLQRGLLSTPQRKQHSSGLSPRWERGQPFYRQKYGKVVAETDLFAE